MGFVFQQPTLLRNLDILDNVVLPAMSERGASRRRLVDTARELMQQMGIGDLENRHITQASGGQLQRVGICRALLHDPAVIFGDEPTGALDSTTAAEIMELLHHIHRSGTTIILVTHDPRVAAKTERVLYLFDGRLAGGALNASTRCTRHGGITQCGDMSDSPICCSGSWSSVSAARRRWSFTCRR